MMTVYMRQLIIEAMEHLRRTNDLDFFSRDSYKMHISQAIEELQEEQKRAYNA